MLEVGKKMAKQMRRNKIYTANLFLQTTEVCTYVAPPIQLHVLKQELFFFYISIPESYYDFSNMVTLGSILASLFSLVNFEHTFDDWLQLAFVD